jgi:Flp pilus assembly protein protease CpaA
MVFAISFYIFSTFLSFTDYKKFLVPNNLILSMATMLFIFGFIESKIYISSIILSLFVLLFFIAIMLINRQIILGGGDIKYMMIVALYLGIQSFALFLVITGLLQTFALIYVQYVKKKKIAPMVPIMFLSTIIVEVLVTLHLYPFKF